MRRKTHQQAIAETGYKAPLDDLSSAIAELELIEDALAGLLKEIGNDSLVLSQNDCVQLAEMATKCVGITKRVCYEHKQLAVEYKNTCDPRVAQKRWINTLTENNQQIGNDLIDDIEVFLDKTVAAQNGRRRRGDGHHRVWLWKNMFDVFIQDGNLLHDLTLLEPDMFDYIVYKVKEYMEIHGGKLYYDLESRKLERGNRSKLPIPHVVFMNFFMKRTNVPPIVVGALFGMHRTAVTRQCEFMDGVLEAVLPTATTVRNSLKAIKTSEEYLKFTGGGILIDGTLVTAPKSNDKDNTETSGYSGKHKTYGFNLGTMVTLTRLILQIFTGPGNRHDYGLLKDNLPNFGLLNMSKEFNSGAESGGDDDNAKDAEPTRTASKEINIEEDKVLDQVEIYGDKAYAGMKKDFSRINSRVMHKGKNKKSLKEIKEAFRTGDDTKKAEALGLTPKQYAENKEMSSVRSRVKHTIGSLKRWGVLRGPFYGTASELKQQAEIISGVVNLETLWADVEKDEAPLLAMLAKKRAKYTKSR